MSEPGDAVDRLAGELARIAGAPVELERPAKEEHGDYATSVALRLAPQRRRSPRELAEELAQQAVELPAVERAEVAGPGFLNLWLTDAWFGEALAEIAAAGPQYGAGAADAPERVQVEMVSANPTGPITVAAARNGAYGDSVARLLEFAGHAVEREYYYNDAGAQMERFRASVEARRRGEEPPEDGYRGDYVDELAKLDGDPVPPMLEQIEATLERFRIHFDSWALQSRLQEELSAVLPLLPTYTADGALFVRSKDFGDEKDRVLVRSAERGGLPTYEAADVVYLKDKLDRGFQRVIYVLGADHQGVRRWYETVARMLGYDSERVEVLLYQLVHLSRGDERAKMSKRRGDVVFLDELRRRDRRRCRPLVPRLARPRPDDRDRRRPRRREVAEEPRLLRPVRARPDRRDPPQRRGRRGEPRRCRARSRARRGSSSSAWPSSPRSSPRRPSGALRMRSRPTRSASRTTSTASTTSIACSAAASGRRSGSRSRGRRRESSRARST